MVTVLYSFPYTQFDANYEDEPEFPEAGSRTGWNGEQNPQFAPFFPTFDSK
jgi:hypothetical protein